MTNKNEYCGYYTQNEKSYPISEPLQTGPKLASGVYNVAQYGMNPDNFLFKKRDFVTDDIVDLPSPEYTKIINMFSHFMKDSTKKLYNDLKYIYKRSVLLYGRAGAGKSVCVNRVSRDVLAKGGIVLWGEDVYILKRALSALNNTQPDDLVMVVFEEFDSLAKRYENDLLSLLDGQNQKNNIIYMCTTNFIDQIPKRLRRPGRISMTVEVKLPIMEARKMFIENKCGKLLEHLTPEDVVELANATEGLTIDELKEFLQSVVIFKEDPDAVLERLKEFSEDPTVWVKSKSVLEDDEDSEMYRY